MCANVEGGGQGRDCCQTAYGAHKGRESSGCPSGRRCRGSNGTGKASELETNTREWGGG